MYKRDPLIINSIQQMTMKENDMYRYMGNMKAKQIKHVRMKDKVGDEYLNRTKSILKIKLNGKSTIKSINTNATTILTLASEKEMDIDRIRKSPNQNENVTH